MVYQLYVKCKEIKEIDEPDEVVPNMCYSRSLSCYTSTYGPNCQARGLWCYESRRTLRCDCCTQCLWYCCMWFCKTPCVNANIVRTRVESGQPLPGRPGCCVLKTHQCCKLYTGDVITIIFRELVCVGFPLGVVMAVHFLSFFEDYNDLEKAGTGLGISLLGMLPVLMMVYCLTQLCRVCLVCSSRCVERCCQGHYGRI